MLDCAEKAIPKKKICSKSKSWFTRELKNLCKNKYSCDRKLKKAKNYSDFIQKKQTFNSAKKRLKVQIDHAKEDFRKEKIEKLSSDPSKKYFWKVMKNYFNFSENEIPSLKLENGRLANSDFEKAQALNDFFAKISVPNEEKFSDEKKFHEELETKLELSFDCKEAHSTFKNFNDYIHVNEIIIMAQKMKSDGAPGPDGIFPCMLKHGGVFLFEKLRFLFQVLLDKRHHPLEWKDANVCPIFKKGEKFLPNNYRPISLTSVLGKLMEAVLAMRVRHFFEESNFLTPNQHGFRKKEGFTCVDRKLV